MWYAEQLWPELERRAGLYPDDAGRHDLADRPAWPLAMAAWSLSSEAPDWGDALGAFLELAHEVAAGRTQADLERYLTRRVTVDRLPLAWGVRMHRHPPSGRPTEG